MRKQLSLCIFAVSLLFSSSAVAQVTSDGSVGTAVVPSGSDYIINGGVPVQDAGGVNRNLFHSFEQFSLSVGESATFNLSTTPTVENIFGRVTGGSLSNIDGKLAITGNNSNVSTNLYLLNPAGVIFGPNAQLLLPGSFFAATADSLLFENGYEFGVSDPQAPALLTISTPTGLQMGENAASIQVNGGGHRLAKLNSRGNASLIAPNIQVGPTTGLQVLPGQSLTLVGNGLELNGGVLTAASGNLELGSIAPGEQIQIGVDESLSYETVSEFRDVELQRRSLANVSGVAVQVDPSSPVRRFTTEQGRLQVTGRNINLTDSSVILGQSGFAAVQPSGTLQVRASEQLFISGSDPATFIRSDITSETIGAVRSGALQIAAQDVTIDGGAGITSITFSDAGSGDINAQISDRLLVSGNNAQNPLLSSTLTSASVISGRSGDVTLAANEILLEAGGGVTTTNVGRGTGGNLRVTADEINIIGRTPVGAIPSTISSSNFGSGTAGNLTVNTRALSIRDTATISATSSGNGNAGNVVIDASERVALFGDDDPSDPNTVITSGVSLPGAFEQLLGLPIQPPSGEAGDVTITAPIFEATGPGGVSVQNRGTGTAGTVRIRADNLTLRDGSEISARTVTGSGGNVDLDVSNVLLLRRGSNINTESQSTGNGGNIRILGSFIIALENSDIFADAVQGNGGNIEITAQSIFGTEFRDQLTPDSDITASSEFGVNGTVEINNLTVAPGAALVALPAAPADADNQIATSCASNDGNQFIASGRGGLPIAPASQLTGSRPWSDVRDLSTIDSSANEIMATNAVLPELEEATGRTLTEADGWQVNGNGQVELLTASTAASGVLSPATCLAQTSQG